MLSGLLLATERRAIIGLASLYASRMLGLFMVLPVLALYADDLAGATPLLIGLALGLAMHMDPTALVSCMVALCAPTAAVCTMFSVIYAQDSELSVSLVSMSTLLSILTMPLIIVLTQTLLA